MQADGIELSEGKLEKGLANGDQRIEWVGAEYFLPLHTRVLIRSINICVA
ncbi:hypothetical protein GF373_02065 [bacterium]|nr:hypothetical protein [bacterium]